jgi:hypothetical protein
MKTFLITISLLLFFLAGSIASWKGLDLRRGSSWLYGVISFLCGLLLGFGLSVNLFEGLIAGAIFAFLTLLSGAIMRRHKLKYKGMASSLLLQYGKEGDLSFFAKLVRRLLGKYKQS